MFPMVNIRFYTKSTTTQITAIHPAIIQSHILSKLDGATLASTSCASSQFLSLCSDDQLWRDLCNSTWPSTTDPRVVSVISTFPSAHRSFYYDSFLSTSHQLSKEISFSNKSQVISAVDIYYKDRVIYSKILGGSTLAYWCFQLPLIPFKLEGDASGCMSLAEEHLKVSWIVIDPINKRAVNVASHKAVYSRLLPWNGDIELCYATVASEATGELVQCFVSVRCRRKERGDLRVTWVEMFIRDYDY